MTYKLRDYQQHASDAAIQAFSSGNNGIIILPTGAGKSLVIADIAARISSPLLVLQPSKEILEQNYAKYLSYGLNDAGLYSASVGRKQIARVTFATIGSIINKAEEFNAFKFVLIDECHLVQPKEGMYKTFLDSAQRKVVGLTATPYRLHTNLMGAELRFITRTRPRIFQDVLYYCQVGDLLSKGFLSHLSYYDMTCIDVRNIRSNTTGTDYEEKSLYAEYQRSGYIPRLVATIRRLLAPKSGIPRKGILVFTRRVAEAQEVTEQIENSAIVSAETPKKEREKILQKFKAGEIKVVVNAQTLTTGFDYPELDTVVMARPTKSLSLWYQCVGRAIRPSPGKEGWIIDLCGNIQRFGKVEDLKLEQQGRGKWVITNNGIQLTNTYIQ